MKHAGHGTGMHYPVKGEKQDAGILDNRKRYDRKRIFAAGKGFSEQLVFPHTNQHRLVAPEILLDHIYGAFQNDADVFDILIFQRNGFPFMICPDSVSETGQHSLKIFGLDSLEERRICL